METGFKRRRLCSLHYDRLRCGERDNCRCLIGSGVAIGGALQAGQYLEFVVVRLMGCRGRAGESTRASWSLDRYEDLTFSMRHQGRNTMKRKRSEEYDEACQRGNQSSRAVNLLYFRIVAASCIPTMSIDRRHPTQNRNKMKVSNKQNLTSPSALDENCINCLKCVSWCRPDGARMRKQEARTLCLCRHAVTKVSQVTLRSHKKPGQARGEGMGDPWRAQIMDIARFRGDTKRRLTRVVARLQPVRAQV